MKRSMKYYKTCYLASLKNKAKVNHELIIYCVEMHWCDRHKDKDEDEDEEHEEEHEHDECNV